MQTEVLSAGRTLKVAIEKTSIPREVEYVQGLIDAVEAYEKTLGVMVYHQKKDMVFRSVSVKHETEPYLNLIKRSMEEDSSLEGFSTYKDISVFFFSFPLKDSSGKNIGGVSILQHTSFMEEEIRNAKRMILLITFLLIGGTVGVVFFIGRRSIHRPIAALLDGIKSMLNRNKLIVFVGAYFGIFLSHGVIMLVGVPVHKTAKELGVTRSSIYTKYTGLSPP